MLSPVGLYLSLCGRIFIVRSFVPKSLKNDLKKKKKRKKEKSVFASVSQMQIAEGQRTRASQ